MNSFTHTLGDTVPLECTILSDAGTPQDLTGCHAALHIKAGGECIVIDGVTSSAAGVASFDLSGLTLPPRVYRASLHMTWADGVQEGLGDLALTIREVC